MKSLNRIQLRRLIPNQFSYVGSNEKKNQFKKLVKEKKDSNKKKENQI